MNKAHTINFNEFHPLRDGQARQVFCGLHPRHVPSTSQRAGCGGSCCRPCMLLLLPMFAAAAVYRALHRLSHEVVRCRA